MLCVECDRTTWRSDAVGGSISGRIQQQYDVSTRCSLGERCGWRLPVCRCRSSVAVSAVPRESRPSQRHRRSSLAVGWHRRGGFVVRRRSPCDQLGLPRWCRSLLYASARQSRAQSRHRQRFVFSSHDSHAKIIQIIPRSHLYCLSLPLCLDWYNGSITPRVHSGVTKRTQCRLHYGHCREPATVE